MKKSIYISALIAAVFLASCKTTRKTQTSEDNPSNSISERLSSFKQIQFEKSFFDGINEKMAGNYQNALRYFQDAVATDPLSDASWYEIANAEVQLGKIDEAEKASKKAVDINHSQNKWYMLQLSDIYRFEKKWTEAEGIYEKLIKIDADDPENYMRLAAVYEADKKPAEALKVYDRIEQHFGPSEEVSLDKEQLYEATGKYDKVEAIMNKMIATEPGNSKYYQILAQAYMKAGKEDKAMEIYEQLAKKNPDDGEIQLSLAEFYYRKGDHDKAFSMLKKAFGNPTLGIDNKIAILYNDYLMQPKLSDADKQEAYTLTETMVNAHPDDAKGHAIYGDFLYQDKKYEEARVQYRKSLESKKSVFAVWQQLLLADAELNDYKSLSEESEKALDYFPNQPIVYFMNGLANIQLKNYKKAATVLESGLDQTIDNPSLEVDFYNNLAEAYYRMNNYAKSFAYFDKALDKDSDNAQALNNYAYYLSVQNQKLDKAEAMSKKSLEKDPGNASYLDTYGWILYKLGRYDDAAKYVKQSLDKEKGSAEVNEHYGDIEYKLGNTDIAVQYWKNAKQFGSDSPNLDKKIANQKIIE